MSNTQQGDADLTATLCEITAPLRELIALLRKMETIFKQEREFILQHHPEEKVGDFPSLNGIETMRYADLEVLKVMCGLAVRHVERRASDVQAEVDEAERIRAENLRRQNMTPLEARVEGLERATAYLAAEITKLKGSQTGRLPSLPHVARANVPQLLGQPGGMGRPAASASGGAGGDVRRLARGADAGGSASASSTVEQGFTRRQHPLDVIGSSGRRG